MHAEYPHNQFCQCPNLLGSLVWASGLYLRPLQQHFHSLGLTNWLTTTRGSDPLVLANLLRQWQDLSFLTSGIPIRPFQAEFTSFTDASNKSWGCPDAGFPDFGFWTHSDHKLVNTVELKGVILAPITVSVLRGHQLMIATDNTTVVAYINKQGGTHSHSMLCLLVGLFLWLQTQDIAIRARHIPGGLNVIGLVDCLFRLNQPITTE